MREIKHTLGPWQVKIDKTLTVLAIGIESPVKIAELFTPYSGVNDLVNKIDRSKDALANAKLIAAAPELLEALVSAINTLENMVGPSNSVIVNTMIESYQSVIKKATE